LFRPDSNLGPPYGLLWFGIFLLFLGVVWTYTGKAWVRLHGWVYRAEEPNWFWWQVAQCWLCGVGLIGYFLYKVYGL